MHTREKYTRKHTAHCREREAGQTEVVLIEKNQWKWSLYINTKPMSGPTIRRVYVLNTDPHDT